MIITSGGCIGCTDEDAALVPQTITMMREEVHRSDLKGALPPYELTSKSSSLLSWPHGSWSETVTQHSLKPSPLRKAPPPPPPPSGQDVRILKTDLEHKKSLWRVFRRRMNEERQMAIQMERQQQKQQMETEAKIQLMNVNEETLNTKESDQIVASLASIDPHGEHGRVEMLLPKMFHLHDCGDRDKHSWSLPVGFWEFWNMLSGQSPRTHGDEEGDTVSTSDETSLASDFTTSEQSQASWYSWQSADTERVSNRGGTRELLMKHFGGENDSPWLAAKRGDLNALENRWKHRHDWTLEDESGNTPLYYACRDGGASNLRVVLFLLQQWPSTQHIPPMLLHRCKQDAANIYVQELLINPCHAEMIIQDFEKNSMQERLEGNDEDSEQEYAHGNKLYDIFEDDDDEEYKEDHTTATSEF